MYYKTAASYMCLKCFFQIAEEMEKERRVFQLQMCEVMSYSISVYYVIGMLINGKEM